MFKFKIIVHEFMVHEIYGLYNFEDSIRNEC